PGPRAAAWFRDLHPDADVVVLETCFRGGQDIADASRAVVAGIGDRLQKACRGTEAEVPVRFWRCRNERAQAQAVAREVEHLIAAGVGPAQICVVVDQPGRRGSAGAAAMEGRSV